MDFVMDNYLWFIVGGIALLMIVIGYFAEKTDFGKKPLSEKKSKEKVKEEVVETDKQETSEEPVVVASEEQGINDLLGGVQEDLTIPLEDGLMEIPATEELNEALPETDLSEEDLNVPFGDAEVRADDTQTLNIPEVVEDSETDEDDVWKF